MIVAMKHEKRRFVEQVDFITSPGFLRGGNDAAPKAGCRQAACSASSPICGVFGFDETTRRMKVLALNPGVTREQVQDNTGFELIFDDQLSVTEPPTEHELTDACGCSIPTPLHRLTVKTRKPHDHPVEHVRHRRAQLHRLSGNAGRQGAGRLRRACGGAGLRLALGLGPHPARRRAEFPDHRFAHHC